MGWIIIYAPDVDEWQVSDGPIGNRGTSYDFKTKKEAEECLERIQNTKVRPPYADASLGTLT